jgi:uncharacterized membrane protein YdjX (TVP38/TMEM64 family)
VQSLSEVVLDPLTLMGEAWRPMRRFLDFIMTMNARAWRMVAVGFLLFGGVGIIFLFVAKLLGFDSEATVEHWMAAAQGPWALPVAVAAFAALAFLGVPQIVLIAGAVVAFGSVTGMAYSWIGTLVSSLVGFGLGRAFGARVLQHFAGERINRFVHLIGRNGFFASMIVRLVPSAPFIVVNVAAGVTTMRFWAFAMGTGIGIIPKIALTAFAGSAALHVMQDGGGKHLLTLIAVVAIWIAVGCGARLLLKAREAKD